MRDGRHGDVPSDRPTPSPAAADRLRAALSAQVAAYAAELDVDLDDIDRATATDRAELAAAVVHQHVDRLAAFRDGVEHLLAAAVVEREAESVVAAASEQLDPLPEGAGPAGDAPPPARARARSRPRARVPARLGVAVVASLLAVLTVAGAPRVVEQDVASSTRRADPQAADRLAHRNAEQGDGLAEIAARTQRLQDAVEVGGPLAEDDVVRQRLGALLADRQDALLQLSLGAPSGTALLERIRELTRDLPRRSAHGLLDDALRQSRARSPEDRGRPRAQPPPPPPAPPAEQEEPAAEPQPEPDGQPSAEADQPAREERTRPSEPADPDRPASGAPPEDDGEESLAPLLDEDASLVEGPAGLGGR